MAELKIGIDDYWAHFVDTLAEATLILDETGLILYANKAACALFEKKHEHLIGSDFSYPLNSESPIEIEINRPNQTLRYGEMMIREGSWKKQKAWIVTLHDITLKKSIEHELQIAANVFKYAKEGIVITDQHGVIHNVNQEFTRITQYTKSEVIGKKMSILHSNQYNHAFYVDMWSKIKSKGYWYGQIWNKKKEGDIFPQLEAISEIKNEANEVTHYVGIFYDITEQEKQKKKLEHMAHFDGLTNLPNRLLLIDRLKLAMRNAKRLKNNIAILFIDLDGFKKINDTFGHYFGDLVLQKVAEIFSSDIRETDTFARYGGDEFVLVLTNIDKKNRYLPLIERIQKQLKKPIDIQAQQVRLTASIGIAIYPQKKQISAEQLIRQADQAMYKSKLSGKGDYNVFNTKIESEKIKKIRFIDEFEHAIKNNQLKLYYQPKINMKTNEILGVEALIRWQHPVRGLRLPRQFLPKIKGHAFLNKLTDWTIKQVLNQMLTWYQKGIKLSVSVNIDPFALEQGRFIQRIRRLIAPYPPELIKYLEFEILESSIISNFKQASKFIEQCNTLGIQFSLDDFGTGYSSINHLLSLPYTYMKVDMHFIQNIINNPRNMKILKAILDIAQAINIDVIAEGVETEDQKELLLALGCTFAQGFLYSKPLEVKKFERWYQAWIKT